MPVSSAPETSRGVAPMMQALVIDPSLFTSPYDEALVNGLQTQGVDATLIARPARDAEQMPTVPYRAAFYKWFDGAPKTLGIVGALLKAAEHCINGLQLAFSSMPKGAVAHFQWLPFPLADRWLLSLMKLRAPVIVTVHDTMPFNGTPTSRFQKYGFVGALRQADRIIVHTQGGRARLVEAGLPMDRITVIPHGPLGTGIAALPRVRHPRWTVVAFGKMRPYKGIDVLVEALATLSRDERSNLRVIIAGEVLMDLAPIRARIEQAELGDCIEIREGFLGEDALAQLFAEADAFVFPYREIEASGVLYLVQGLGRWIIASKMGAFSDAISDEGSGALVPPEDPVALGRALHDGADAARVPTAPPNVMEWPEIACKTLAVYRAAQSERRPGSQRSQAVILDTQDPK